MRFHVLGIGSIGGLLAHNLRQTLAPEHAVVLVHKRLDQLYKSQRRGGLITVARDGVVQKSAGYRSEVWRVPWQSKLDKFALKEQKKERYRLLYRQRNDHPEVPTKVGGRFQTSAPIESLFVTTKAGGVVAAVKELVPRLPPRSTIVLLNNGMGVYESLMSEVFRNPLERPHIILAVNNNGAYLKHFMNIVHSGPGSLKFGIVPDAMGRDYEARPNTSSPLLLDSITTGEDPHSDRYISLRNTVAALSSLEGMGATWQPISSVLLAMKRKLVVNAIINPLTALMNCRNGDVLQSTYARHITQRVCREAAQAFAAEHQAEMGMSFPSGDGQEKPQLWRGRLALLPPPLEPRELEEEVWRVVNKTAENTSSMLVDVRRGRGTEIEFMNGYLMRLGWSHDVRMHTTAALYNLIKMREVIPFDNLLK